MAPLEETTDSFHHSCDVCRENFVFDYSVDKSHPLRLSEGRWKKLNKRLGDIVNDVLIGLERDYIRAKLSQICFFDVCETDIKD